MVFLFSKYILLHTPFSESSHLCKPFFKGMYGSTNGISLCRKFSTLSSDHCERLSWERSAQEILLGRLKLAWRNHQSKAAFETFHDFKTLWLP